MKKHTCLHFPRRDHEPPPVVAELGWRYHHLGIPIDDPLPEERYIPHLKLYVTGFETSPFGIEFMRFDPDSPVSDLVKKVPHIAFTVDDIESAIRGRETLGGVESPSAGVKVAMIVENGVPIELLEFCRSEDGE